MPDPFDSFQLPSELCELLPDTEQQTLREEILEIHVRLLKRDPDLEDNRSRGAHLWPLFDAIASRLQFQPNFREHFVPTLIPKFVEQIRSALSWYPHGAEGLEYFLKPVIVRWQHSNPDAQATTNSKPTEETSSAPPVNDMEEFQGEDGIKAERDRRLAAARERWRGKSGRNIPFSWIHEAAGVDHKDAYDWKNGKLPESSSMSKSIERILNQPSPPTAPIRE
jgi:hypothetical protein